MILRRLSSLSATQRERLEARLRRLHEEQGGAVALLILAATLIIFMMSLVIYDAGDVGRDKLEVQNAADVAVWSQTAVEARTMNMIAFANVGKKVTFGMTSYYQALIISYTELEIAALALAVICWVANFFAGGSLTQVCLEVTSFAAEVAYLLFEEGPDIIKFETDLNKNYFAKDMKAFDDYQSYMIGLTPWWGWAEGFLRGSRNGASLASGWPVPRVLESIPGSSGMVDGLPVQKPDPIITKGYLSNMCTRLYSNSEFDSSGAGMAAVTSDVLVHSADYILKSCVLSGDDRCIKNELNIGRVPWRPVIFALTPLMAAAQTPAGCAIQAAYWENVANLNGAGAPYEIQMFNNDEPGWLLKSSNLMFAYKSAPERMSDTGARKKYGFISKDYESNIPLLYDASGTWSISRAEISYQFGDSDNLQPPDLWHPSWTVRMRPVALPGEWAGVGDTTLSSAWRDALPYVVAGAAADQLMSGTFDLESAAADLLRVEAATLGLDDDSMEGVSR